jgi:hypothetical protein
VELANAAAGDDPGRPQIRQGGMGSLAAAIAQRRPRSRTTNTGYGQGQAAAPSSSPQPSLTAAAGEAGRFHLGSGPF